MRYILKELATFKNYDEGTPIYYLIHLIMLLFESSTKPSGTIVYQKIWWLGN